MRHCGNIPRGGGGSACNSGAPSEQAGQCAWQQHCCRNALTLSTAPAACAAASPAPALHGNASNLPHCSGVSGWPSALTAGRHTHDTHDTRPTHSEPRSSNHYHTHYLSYTQSRTLTHTPTAWRALAGVHSRKRGQVVHAWCLRLQPLRPDTPGVAGIRTRRPPSCCMPPCCCLRLLLQRYTCSQRGGVYTRVGSPFRWLMPWMDSTAHHT